MERFIADPVVDCPIVLAADDADTRRLLQRQLESAGYRVTACADGRAALEALGEVGDGILVADWSMPEMDGLELCRAVRELQSMQALQCMHVILLTAHGEKHRIVEGLEAGADDYLTKPYHTQELLARIRAGERTWRLQRELFRQRLETQKANTTLLVLNDKLEKLASTDTLTGLYNRRIIFERLGEAWALAQRTGADFGCIMLDVDRFKLVNDTRGHQAGDAVLSYVARVIRDNVRPYDVVGRFGGEEFIVLCTGTDQAKANEIAERIRAALAAASITVEGGPLSVTLSAGTAVRCPRHHSPDALVADADAMLYEAKDRGRNRVCWLGPGDVTQTVNAPADSPAT